MIDHPSRIRKETLLRVGVHVIDLPELDPVIQVRATGLQKHRVEPSPLGVRQIAALDYVERVDECDAAFAPPSRGIDRRRSTDAVEHCTDGVGGAWAGP